MIPNLWFACLRILAHTSLVGFMFVAMKRSCTALPGFHIICLFSDARVSHKYPLTW